MIVKNIKYKEFKNSDKKRISELMDVFVKRQGLKPVSNADIKRTMSKKGYSLFATLNEKKEMIGIASLIEMNIFTAKVGNIEEVVVHKDYRGQGVATEILKAIIKVAKKKKMDYLKLNTNVKNISNGLYLKLGFVRKDDNLYKLYLK